MISEEKKNRIIKSVKSVLAEIPSGVTLLAAAKTRTDEEVLAAIEAGITHIGHNYVQEAENMHPGVGDKARWRLIGHLQRNKAKKAVPIFDMIETIDSVRLANKVDKECAKIEKVMPVLIEINIGREESKSGVLPEKAEDLVRNINHLEHLRIRGIMTMAPYLASPEDTRPYFRETREIFEHLKNAGVPNVEMKYLSMGMSHSWRVAIEEGANIVRLGTSLFGPR